MKISKDVLDDLLPQLKKIQKSKGFIDNKSLEALSKKTKIPTAIIWQVATFYSLLQQPQSHLRYC